MSFRVKPIKPTNSTSNKAYVERNKSVHLKILGFESVKASFLPIRILSRQHHSSTSFARLVPVAFTIYLGSAFPCIGVLNTATRRDSVALNPDFEYYYCGFPVYRPRIIDVPVIPLPRSETSKPQREVPGKLQVSHAPSRPASPFGRVTGMLASAGVSPNP